MGYIEYENNAWYNLYWKGSADRIKTLKNLLKHLILLMLVMLLLFLAA